MNDVLLIVTALSNMGLIILWLRLYYKGSFVGRVELNLPIFLASGWFLYGVLPSLDSLTHGQVSSSEIDFAISVLIALFALIIGNLFSGVFLRKNKQVNRVNSKIKDFVQGKKVTLSGVHAFLFIILMFFIVDFYISNVFGSWLSFLFKKYGFYEVTGINSFTASAPLLIVAIILVMNARFIFINSRSVRFLLILASIIVIIIFLLGGNRNLGVMMFFAMLYSYGFRRKVNFYFIILLLLLSVLFSGIIAVYREYGIINVILGGESTSLDNLIRYMFAINEGEFGTMFRVQNYAKEVDSSGLIIFPGFSYIVSPIVNLIPKLIFLDRPDTLSVMFTKEYWGISNGIMIGLGFSPIVEAKLNFNYLWPVVFIIYGFIIEIIMRSSVYSVGRYFLIASLSAASLNFYRIDLAIYIKFSITIALFCLIIYGLLRLIGKTKPEEV
jgi:hypothetical protein